MPAHTRQSSTAPAAQQHTNRLANETSPYLLQHKHNPVDWYAWGPEAFEAARQQNKLIFLSIGYSTCYWCHVMERESFENEEIAAIMNDLFISIKVDREERPDVDDLYMTAVQLLNNGQGGWPMSVFLEPANLRPFLAGTYFPPQDKFGRPGFPGVLRQVAAYWKDQREAVVAQAEQVAKLVASQHAHDAVPRPIGAKQVEKAISDLLASYDSRDGGFVSPGQRAPKFPTPVNLEFLMGAAWQIKPARDAVLHTLDRMAIGGMYDQVGGGFHRYSVDEKWLVPHFEKMLYDNAQLAQAYLHAYELTKDEFYAQVARGTLEYVLREMTADGGGFFSAQDAEVNTREGGNYIWNADEVTKVLHAAGLKDDVPFALEAYGLAGGTNFQDPHHPDDPPRNVLFLADKPAALAARSGTSLADFQARLQRVKSALLAARDKRDQPSTDDKVLAGWNGLMIAAMADGGRVLNNARYTDAARRAAEFVLARMRSADGGLLRTWREGQARIDAFLEDYAFMIKGLLALHRATNDRRMVDEAVKLAQQARSRFWDESGGAYFDTLAGQSDLFVRIKTAHDGAVPCGNSVMLHNLLDLHEQSTERSQLEQAQAALKALSSAIDQRPTATILSTLALHRTLEKSLQGAQGQAAAAAQPSKPRIDLGLGRSGPVQVTCSVSEVQVKAGAPASFEVIATISKPYHINAHKPGEDFLIPLKIDLVGAQGLTIVVDYPQGESLRTEISESPMFVHSGAVRIPVRVEQTGAFSGRPQVFLTYQACTDKECLEPKRELVPIRIVAAR